MALGVWLAAQTEAQQYNGEVERLKARDSGAIIMYEEVVTLFEEYGVCRDKAQGVVEDLMRDQEMWLKVSTLLSFVQSHAQSSRRRLISMSNNSSPPT
jgi:hypothetical protein